MIFNNSLIVNINNLSWEISMKAMRLKKNSKGSVFKKTSFEDLTNMLIQASSVEKRERINLDLKNNKLEFPNIAYLYLEITRKANSILVDQENYRSNLEKSYSNILNLISKTLNIETIQPKDESGEIDGEIRDRQLRSLWKDREQLNETMSHYVRQIQNLREKKYSRITIYLSVMAIIISLVLPVILKFFFP